MKYVITTVLDQTMGFYTADGPSTHGPFTDWTVVHKEAKFYDSEEEARAAFPEMMKGWNNVKESRFLIEPVEDVEEFCAREDTW